MYLIVKMLNVMACHVMIAHCSTIHRSEKQDMAIQIAYLLLKIILMILSHSSMILVLQLNQERNKKYET